MQVAQRYVGVKESGNNRGEPARLFMLPYGYGAGTMWCGLFVHHVFTEASVKHGVKGAALAANWSVPASAIVHKWGKPVAGKQPMSGDVAMFRFGGRRICHVELVINWPADENYFWVIGGNTSNPANLSQEGVFAKRRLKSDCLIVNRIDNYN